MYEDIHKVPGLTVFCVFLTEASCYHASKGRVIVSDPKSKEQQK